jgi:hypothetical protein
LAPEALAIFSGSFEEKAAKAQRMGFHGVELMIAKYSLSGVMLPSDSWYRWWLQ